MKTLIATLALTATIGASAMDMITVEKSTNTKLFNSEAQALQAALAIESKIDAGKFKSSYANFDCEDGSDAEYSKRSVEVKKLYIDGKAKFQGIVNFAFTCEEMYVL